MSIVSKLNYPHEIEIDPQIYPEIPSTKTRACHPNCPYTISKHLFQIARDHLHYWINAHLQSNIQKICGLSKTSTFQIISFVVNWMNCYV